jgi:hypothetical protein
MLEIPTMTMLDIAFGNIKHLPKEADIPQEFWHDSNKWHKFIVGWFFSGVKQEGVESLKPKPGVDKMQALAAVQAILCSYAPKHEHKEAGCAFLMSEWFE